MTSEIETLKQQNRELEQRAKIAEALCKLAGQRINSLETRIIVLKRDNTELMARIEEYKLGFL